MLACTFMTNTFGIDLVTPIKADDECVFTDICDTGDAAYDAIKFLKEKQFLKGNPDGTFRPDDLVNRAEIMAIAFRGFGGEVSYDPAFTLNDIKGSEWFAPYISTAKKNGFVQGYPDGTYRAGDNVKMEEAAKIFIKFYKLPEPDISKSTVNSGTAHYDIVFPGYQIWDTIPFKEWYTPFMKVVYDYALLDPYNLAHDAYGENGPVARPITRRQVATLLYNILNRKADITAPLSMIGTWESYAGNTKRGQDLYFYFNKPVDLTEAKKYIRLTINGSEVKNYTLFDSTWIAGNHLVDLEDYAYYPQELRFNSNAFNQNGKVELIFMKGLKDIYGTSLQQEKKFAFTLTEDVAKLQLSGPSYFMTGGDTTNTLTQQYVSSIKATVCSVNMEQYLKSYQINSTEYYETNPNFTHEYLDLATGAPFDQRLSALCNTKKEKNLSTTQTLSTSKINLADIYGNTLNPGIYFTAFQAPEFTKNKGNFNTQRFVYVSDTSLTLKTDSAGMASVWAINMKNGKPESNLNVSLFEVQGSNSWENTPGGNSYKLLEKATTNAEGKSQFGTKITPESSVQYIVIADGNNHFGIVNSSWKKGIEPYQFGIQSDIGYWNYDWSSSYDVFMHTDRKIYRPEQEVNIKGIIRKRSKDGFILPSMKTVNLTAYDALSKEIWSKQVSVNKNGSYTASFTLSGEASLGSYSVTAKSSNPADDTYFGEPSTSFQVENYRKPEFKVDFNLADKYISGDTINTTVDASYYFGGAVKNAKAHIELQGSSLYMYSKTNEWYNFFDSYACYYYCSEGSIGGYETDITLDSSGKGVLSIPLSLDTFTSSGLYTMEVTVTDASERSVTNRKSFAVHKVDTYVGIKTDNYVSAPNQSITFDLTAINTDRDPVPNKPVTVEFFKEEWTSYTRSDVSDNMITNNAMQETKIAETSTTIDAKGYGKVSFVPKEPGTYFARATIVDSKGNKASAREYTYVYATDSTFVPWPGNDGFQVQLHLDKPEYKSGDNAKLIIQSPFEKATALITIERETILDSMVVELTNNTTPISIPVKKSYIPNAFVSVALFSSNGTPDFRQGYTQLVVDTKEQELHIDLSTDKKTYKPGDKVTLTVHTQDNSGKNVPAEVSVAVVDEAVIALAGGVNRDIMNAFYYFRGIMVDTAQSLTHLVQKGTLETVGGSGKGGESGLPMKRGNMKDTAYWNGTLDTDSNGNGTVMFTLPDNLTSWEILSIGATNDTKVGSAAISINSKIDFVAEPLLPRFVRTGDQVQINYSLFNLTDKDADVDANLTIEGVSVPESSKKVFVKAGGSVPVSWNITVPSNISSMKLTITASGANTSGDRLESILPVYPAQVVDTIGSSGKITGTTNITLPVSTLTAEEKSTGILTLNVSAGLTGSLKQQLSYLLIYPYGCAEQTTSVLFANIVLKDYLERSHISLPSVTPDAIEKNVSAAFQKLYNYQAENGGWSLWGGNDYVENYLTAYVLSGLSTAEQSGFGIDVNVVKKGRDYLFSQISSGKMTNPNELAFSLYVLKGLGVRGVTGYAENIFKNRTTLSTDSKGYLMMLYKDLASEADGAQKTLYEGRVTTLKNDLLSLLSKDGNMTYLKVDKNADYFNFMYGNVPANAHLLKALAYVDPTNASLDGLVAYLTSQARDDRWASTHETAATILAISEYLSSREESTESFSAKVSINGVEKGTAVFKEGSSSDSYTLTLPGTDFSNTSTISISAPEGKTLYYQASMNYQKTAKKQYVENPNFVIKRTIQYYKADGSLTVSPTLLHLGDKVRVTVTYIPHYTGDNSRKRIAIEDHLPAGLEALNPGLNTTGKTDTSFDTGWADHMEMRDQLVMVYIQDARQIQFSYDAQAIAPGTFSYPAVHAFEMYNPTIYAKSGATALRIER